MRYRVIMELGRGNRAAAPTMSGRKVRTPRARVLGNAQAPRGDGQCHRDHTADGPPTCRGTQARVKRCGKSAPGPVATRGAGKPHLEQGLIGGHVLRLAGGHGARPSPRVGRLIPIAMSGLERWPPSQRKLGYRIRLTSCLGPFPFCHAEESVDLLGPQHLFAKLP